MHIITGAPTSIAAFAGWANRGPTNEALLVTSWFDFANQYGGFEEGSYLGYAVNQFFDNGGQQAYVVRIAWDQNLNLTPNSGSPLSCETAMCRALGAS